MGGLSSIPPKASDTQADWPGRDDPASTTRSEEHTSELQSRQYLVCRLLLEKKKKARYSRWRPLCRTWANSSNTHRHIRTCHSLTQTLFSRHVCWSPDSVQILRQQRRKYRGL